MANISEIAQLGAPVLRLHAQMVTEPLSAQTRQIIETLQDTLATTQGVGIAAPQISVSKRIIIIASRPTSRYPSAPLMEPTVMINPAFQPLSETREKDWEGCLSVPGIRALVPRYTEILINYINQQNDLVEARLDGFVARVFQHEFDHLEGTVYLDRVEDNRDIFAESEYFKI
ncbi:MAG: peptide deformylase [Methylococcales bacterium]|nr:peptide deformylase [Methylococcales bacterium]MDD5631869.1 peptide deformylase [Methylococcales bacterium]